MEFAIIISTQHRLNDFDLAGENIKHHLLQLYGWKSCGMFDGNEVYSLSNLTMYTVNNECIHHELLDKKINTDCFIFATTHTSASGIHSLSVHTIGNVSVAQLGGREKTLGIAPANILKALFQTLVNYGKESEFEIIQEATHHGPYLETPAVFIEIGSDESEWANQIAGVIIAKTIVETLTRSIQSYPSAIGIGGPHHCPQFKDIQLGNMYAVGHIIAKYNLEFFNQAILSQALIKTIPSPTLAILDWKGLKEHKERIVDLLTINSIAWKKTKDF